MCPSCGENILLEGRIHVRQNVNCPKCQELLAVISLDPIILELSAFANNMDWSNTDKLEGAKRHQRKYNNKHRFDENEDEWRKQKKSNIRS